MHAASAPYSYVVSKSNLSCPNGKHRLGKPFRTLNFSLKSLYVFLLPQRSPTNRPIFLLRSFFQFFDKFDILVMNRPIRISICPQNERELRKKGEGEKDKGYGRDRRKERKEKGESGESGEWRKKKGEKREDKLENIFPVVIQKPLPGRSKERTQALKDSQLFSFCGLTNFP